MKKLLLLSLLCSFGSSYMAEAAAASAAYSESELLNGYYSSEEPELSPLQKLVQAYEGNDFISFFKILDVLLKGSNQQVTLENPDGTQSKMPMSSLTVLMIANVLEQLDQNISEKRKSLLKMCLRRLLRMLATAFTKYESDGTLQSKVSGGYYNNYTTYDLVRNLITESIESISNNPKEYNLHPGDVGKFSHITQESEEKGELTLANRVKQSVCSATSAVASAVAELIDRQQEARAWQREVRAVDGRDSRDIEVEFPEEKDEDSRSASPTSAGQLALDDSGNGHHSDSEDEKV